MKLRWTARLLLILGGLLVATALVLRSEFAGRIFCAQGERLASRLAGAEIRADRCAIEPLSARVVVEGLSVRSIDAGAAFFSARRVAVRFVPWLAFGGAPSLGELEIERPHLALDLSSPSADEPKSPGEDGCLAPLRALGVNRVALSNGSAVVRLPGGRTVTVVGADLSARRRSGRYRIEAGLAGALDGGPELSLERMEVHALLDPVSESVRFEKGTFALSEGSVELSGAINHLCNPELALSASARAGVEPLLALAGARQLDASGLVEVTATADGRLSAPRFGARISVAAARIGKYEPGELFATLSLEGETLSIEELTLPLGGGAAHVTGTVALVDDFPVELRLRTEKLEFHRLLDRLAIHNTPVMMSIDSTHRLAGKLGGGFLLAGSSEVTVHGFRVRNRPWHVSDGTTVVEVPGAGRIDTPIRITAKGVELPAARIGFGPGTVLEADVYLGFTTEDGLRIRARSGHFELAHIASHLAGIPVAGAGPVDAVIAGPYADPLITGTVRLSGARLFSAELGTVGGKVTSRPGDASLDFEEVDGRYRDTAYGGTVRMLLGESDGSLDARLAVREGGRLEDVFNATSGLVEPLAWLDRQLAGKVSRFEGHVYGPFERLSAVGQLEASSGTLLTRPFDRLSVTLKLDNGTRLVLEDARLTRGDGEAHGGGEVRFPLDRPVTVDANLDARGLPVRELLGEFAEAIDLTGGVGGQLHLRGRFDALALSGELHAEQLVAGGVKLPGARLSLEDQGGQVIVRGPVIGAGHLAGTLRLVPGLPFDAGFELDVTDLARYLPEGTGIGGALRGLLEARGTLESLEASRGAVALERLVLAVGDYRVANDGPVNATFDGPSFVLGNLVARGENTELSLRGGRLADGRLDLAAQGTFDARLLSVLIPEIEHGSGVVELQAALTGTGERPSLVGSAQVRRGAFRLRTLPLAVTQLRARLSFSQNRVIVEDATLRANGGATRVHGTVGIGSWAPSRFDLTADVERASWALPEDFPAVVSGRLALTGDWPDRLLLSGGLTVDRLRYPRELDLEAMLLDFGRKVQQTPSLEEREWLRLDIALIGGDDMRIENDLLRAKLQFVAPPGSPEGRLELVGSNVRIGLLGSVEVVEGLAFFRGNEYRLRQGVVGFGHRDRLDPEIDFTAETEVREYRVMVHGFGRLLAGTGFQLQLSSDPPLPRADVLTLLAFGITSRDPSAGGNAAAGAGVAAEALWKVSGLDAQVRRWLPDSEVFRDPTVNVTSQYSEITGQLEPTASFETKFLDERLRLKASTPFATPKGRRASVEYRVDENLSGQLLWENEETGYEAGDLGLDLKLRWEWD